MPTALRLLFVQVLLEQLLDPGRSFQVGIHRQGAAEEVQGELHVARSQVDLAGAGEGAEVVRGALDDLVAVLQRTVVVAQQETDRRALVPPFGEVRLAQDEAPDGKGDERNSADFGTGN